MFPLIYKLNILLFFICKLQPSCKRYELKHFYIAFLVVRIKIICYKTIC